MTQLAVLLSCPSDVSRERDRLDAVIGEMSTVFRSQGVYFYTWKYDVDGYPTLDGSPQDDLDRQLPAYDIYVGLMCSRLGTPTHGVASGTVKEFLDAKERWERTGAPRILFYFCRDPSYGDTAQIPEVNAFREQFPGLFSTFNDGSDLQERFRLQFLRCVLDVLNPTPTAIHATRPWIARVAEAVDRGENRYASKPSVVARSTREQAEKLFGLGHLLTPREQTLLTAVAYVSATEGTLEERIDTVLEASAPALESIASAIKETQRLIEGDGPLGSRTTVDELRCDLVAAIVRVDRFIRRADLPQQVRRSVEVNEGVVGARYVVPGAAWIEPLRTLEASRFGVLWSEVKQSCIAARAVFVLDDILFAIEPQPGPDDPHALEQIRAMTPPIVAAFHFAHHLGDEISCFEALRAATRLPLPTTHFDRDLVFQLDPAHAHRLRIRDEGGQTATILSAKGENELRFSGAPGATYEWELRRLYDDDIMSNPIGVGEATALTESQQTWRALTTSANDSIFSLGSLGCWNDVIAVVLQRPEPTDEQLVLLHAIFDQSLSWWDAKGIATLQDKTFRDAINAVFTLLEQRRTRP